MSYVDGQDTENTENSPLLQNQLDKAVASHGESGNRATTTNTSDHENQEPVSQELSTSQLLLVESGIWLGCFLAALDSTVIATLSAPISATFNSLSLLSWLASAYLIANAAFQSAVV